MESHVEIAAVAVPVILLATALLFVFLRRCRRKDCPHRNPSLANLQEGIAKLHCNCSSSCVQPDLVFHSLNRPLPGDATPRRWNHLDQPVFSWDDHPTLVAEASDGGWPRFAFCNSDPCPMAEVGWEIPRGSTEFMQAVRLNSVPNRFTSGRNHNSAHGEENRYCSVMMDLPLPGPSTESTSFPGEAYFEITVLYVGSELRRPVDRFKRMFRRHKSTSDLPVFGERRAGDDVIALGLSRGGCDHNSGLVGTYSGSVGFVSDGSVHLDGSKLVEKTRKYEWGRTNRTIGCGLNPKKKKVIFTLGSEIKHAINCSSSTFSKPLFPTLVANMDVMILVNLGQMRFAYGPPNIWRSPNPCISMKVGDPDLRTDSGYVSDLSQELFSIGGIDPLWRGNGHDMSTSGTSAMKGNTGCEDIDIESDLFEIDLVVSGESKDSTIKD